MPAMSLDGTEVFVSEFRRVTPYEVGERIRTADGTLRSSVRDTKEQWRVTATEVSGSDYTTLLGLITQTATHTLTGDLVGGSSYTVVTVLEDDQALSDAASFGRVVRFRMEEV